MRPASEPHRPCTVRQPAPAPSGYGPVAARWRYTETKNETPMELNQGDMVTLRTGGPRMTVTKVIGHHTTRLEEIAYHRLGYSEGDAVCEWTDAEGPQTGVFEAEALQPCPDA